MRRKSVKRINASKKYLNGEMSRKSEFGQKKKLCVEKVQISFSELNASRKCKEPKRVSISGPQKCTKVVLKKWTHTPCPLDYS